MIKDRLTQPSTLGVFLALVSLLALACGPAAPTIAPITATATPAPAATPTTAPTEAAGPTATPQPTATEAATQPGASNIELNFAVLKRQPDNRVVRLEDGGRVASLQDHFGIYFEPELDAFVYILLRGSSGEINVLFPNQQFSDQTNPVPAHTPVWVPTSIEHWFFLDENIGRENIIVVASREPQEALEALLADLQREGQREEVLGPLAGLLQQFRDLGGVNKIGTESISSTPSGVPSGLDVESLRQEGDNFVHEFNIEHVDPEQQY